MRGDHLRTYDCTRKSRPARARAHVAVTGTPPRHKCAVVLPHYQSIDGWHPSNEQFEAYGAGERTYASFLLPTSFDCRTWTKPRGSSSHGNPSSMRRTNSTFRRTR